VKTATTVAGWGSTRRSKFDSFLEGLDALQPLVVHAMQPLAVHAMAKRCEKYREDSLDAEVKVRYEKKLQLIGLATCPYKLSSEAWIDDVTLWPSVEFPEIVLYISVANSWKVHSGETKGLQESGSLQLLFELHMLLP